MKHNEQETACVLYTQNTCKNRFISWGNMRIKERERERERMEWKDCRKITRAKRCKKTVAIVCDKKKEIQWQKICRQEVKWQWMKHSRQEEYHEDKTILDKNAKRYPAYPETWQVWSQEQIHHSLLRLLCCHLTWQRNSMKIHEDQDDDVHQWKCLELLSRNLNW